MAKIEIGVTRSEDIPQILCEKLDWVFKWHGGFPCFCGKNSFGKGVLAGSDVGRLFEVLNALDNLKARLDATSETATGE